MYQFITLLVVLLGLFSTRVNAQSISADKAALNATRNIQNGNVLIDYSTPSTETVSVFMQRDSISVIHFVKDKKVKRGVYSLEVNKKLLPSDSTAFYYTIGRDTLRALYIDQ